jgi:hypothetical protein
MILELVEYIRQDAWVYYLGAGNSTFISNMSLYSNVTSQLSTLGFNHYAAQNISFEKPVIPQPAEAS